MFDPRTRDKFFEWLGREPHPSANGQKVLKISNPKLSGRYRFEWHPKARKVYLIRVAPREIGEVLAFNIETHGDAANAVLIWSRGFNEGQTPNLIKTHLAE